MKDLFCRLCRWILTVAGLYGATSCDLIGSGRVEYGTPYCTFEVKCKVVDSVTGQHVKGVRLTPGFKFDDADYGDESSEGFIPYYKDADETSDGVFEMNGTKYINQGKFEILHIRLTDPDPATFGHYKDTTYQVTLKKISDADKDTWNTGSYGADVTVKAESVSSR